MMKKPSPSAVLLRSNDIGQLGRDANLLTRLQVPVIGLLTVRGDDADIACLVEQFDDLAQRVVIGRTPPRPIIVQTWIIAGGATVPGWPAAFAADSST